MIQFDMRNNGNEIDVRLNINMVALVSFFKRLTALMIALTAFVGAIIQFGALFGWW
jgi:hypothetical protein